MFRRPRRPLPPGIIPGAPPIDEVARASQLLASGQPEQAALEFMRLSRLMKAGGRPRQAANLHAQAALAWADAGVGKRAINQAGMAMSMFTRLGMMQRAAEFKSDFMQRLRDRGLADSAAAADEGLNAEETAAVATAPADESPRRGKLPVTCPHCGAPVRSDEVDWIDDASAECGFCGGTIGAT